MISSQRIQKRLNSLQQFGSL